MFGTWVCSVFGTCECPQRWVGSPGNTRSRWKYSRPSLPEALDPSYDLTALTLRVYISSCTKSSLFRPGIHSSSRFRRRITYHDGLVLRLCRIIYIKDKTFPLVSPSIAGVVDIIKQVPCSVDVATTDVSKAVSHRANEPGGLSPVPPSRGPRPPSSGLLGLRKFFAPSS